MDLAQEFCDLYQGLNRAHGRYTLGKLNEAKGKMDGRAETVLEQPTVEKWNDHLIGRTGIGIIPIRDDATVRWGAIDIDVYPLDINLLFQKVLRYDLPCVVLRTKSGGAHVTCYASEDVPAKLMRARMMEMSVALGYPGVEIYPKQVSLASERDVGNWLNMPYFDHARTTRYAVYKGKALTAEEFIRYAKHVMVTKEQLENLVIDIGPDFADGPPCLQIMGQEGLQPGKRNDAMFAYGVYCRTKYGDDWEKEFEALNAQLCDPPLPSSEIQAIIKSLKKKSYFYPCKKAPCATFCNKELCKTREFGVGQQANELNVSIGSLVKVNHADAPTWIIDVDGVRFELDTQQLMNQSLFHALCVEKTNKWPNTIKPFEWQTMVNNKLENVEIITPPQDSSVEGRFLQYLEQFLTTTALARSNDELLQGKPWTEEGKTYFRSNDLLDYLERQHFRNVNQRQAWNILRRNGAVHKQLHIKGRCVQVWAVNEYARQNEPHDVPDFDEGQY
jgi:Primase C terminal 1 (PriCT-1).